MTAPKLTIGAIFARTAAFLADDAALVGGLFILLTVASTAADVARTNVNLLFNIAALVSEYFLLVRLLRQRGLIGASGPGGFWPFVGLSMLSWIGLFFAFVFFMVPGILLGAVWLPAGALLIAKGRGVTRSLVESMALTQPHLLPIAITLIALVVPVAFGIVFAMNAMNELGIISPLGSLVLNACLFGSMIVGWYMGAAVYALLAERPVRLGEVFA